MDETNSSVSFDELIAGSNLPVLVDFWAEWCGPCRLMGPIIQQIAREFSGRIMTVKVNIDRKPEIAQKYQIASIPTVILFWKDQPIVQITGLRPIDEIRQQISARIPTT